jgi:hypothetical protein
MSSNKCSQDKFPLSLTLRQTATAPLTEQKVVKCQHNKTDSSCLSKFDYVGMSPMAPPAPFLDGPPDLFEPKVDFELELPLLVRVLDPFLFFPAGPVDFALLPRLGKPLPLPPPRPGPLARPPVQVLDSDRLDRVPGFLNLLSFEDVEGRVGIPETLKMSAQFTHGYCSQEV